MAVLLNPELAFRFVCDFMPVAFAMFDTKMRYIIVNDRWRMDYELGDRDIIGHSHYEIFPDIPDTRREIHRRSLKGEPLQEGENCFERQDGTFLWLRWAMRPWYADNGKIGGIVVFTEDIRLRKQAEEGLIASKNKYKTLFDNTLDALLITDIPAWEFTEVNRSAARLFRATNGDEMIGLTPLDVSPEYQPDGVSSAERAKQLRSATMNDGHCVFEWTHQRMDGTPFPAEVMLTRMEVDGQDFILGSVRDLSIRKTLETELVDIRKRMEALLKRQVAAETAAAFAHELGQPLQGIASYGEASLAILDAEITNLGKLRNAIEEGNRLTSRASKSIAQLLELVSADRFSKEAFDINEEIHRVLTLAKTEHELQFHSKLHLEDNLPKVLANRTHVQKALLNLLHNGIEAMHSAGVPMPAITIIVRTRKDKNVAQVTIRDNGSGMKAEEIEDAFRPFFTTKSNGMGMGLAISRSLIEANGGQLWIDPGETPGTTIHLTIPFA